MKTFMKFYDNQYSIIYNISTNNFNGDEFNLREIKDRFNSNFINNQNVRCLEISFYDESNKINKKFIAGFKVNRVFIIDTDSKIEYSPKEFGEQLDIINEILITKQNKELQSIEQ